MHTGFASYLNGQLFCLGLLVLGTKATHLSLAMITAAARVPCRLLLFLAAIHPLPRTTSPSAAMAHNPTPRLLHLVSILAPCCMLHCCCSFLDASLILDSPDTFHNVHASQHHWRASSTPWPSSCCRAQGSPRLVWGSRRATSYYPSLLSKPPLPSACIFTYRSSSV